MSARASRLSRKNDFNFLLETGRRGSGKHLSLVAAGGRDGQRRIAISISKKVAGAVQRNKIKRRIRELFRLNVERFPPAGHVLVVCRRGTVELPLAELRKELFRLLEKVSR